MLTEWFQKYDDEFLRFEDIEVKLSSRPDLHAFILLDQLLPEEPHDVLSSAGYEEVWLSFDPDKVAEVITEDQVRDLVRCGVRYDPSYEGFCMFV